MTRYATPDWPGHTWMLEPAKLPDSYSLFPARRDLAASLPTDGGFSLLWWATPSPGTHSLCLSFASRPQALTTKSARLFGGLTSDVRSHRAKPRTQRTSRHFSLQWRVRGWQPQTACPSPALAPLVPDVLRGEWGIHRGKLLTGLGCFY